MTKADDDLVEKARECLSLAINADRENRLDALDDLRVLTGLEQWPADIQAAREAENRPCLVINQLPQFLRQVTGDLRAMNPSIAVTPADSAADKNIAEIYKGLIRHIQYRSDASSVYERAGESAAACGMGYFRLLTEYEREDSFNQDIRIESVMNPFSVYFDPKAVMPTREDADWCFVTEFVDDDDFKEQYPKASVVPVSNDGATDNLQNWREGQKVVIAEYFWKERAPATLYMLGDGTTTFDKPLAPVMMTAQRETTRTKVMWAKVSGKDVLDGPKETVWNGIPVIAVMGEELYAGDRIYRSSVIRHAKDPQRMFNFWWTAATETVALQPKSPYLGTAVQFAGFEQFWNVANSENRAVLPYNADPLAPGPPQRAQPPMQSQGMADMLTRSGLALRETTGIKDAALGGRSNEHSGIAIRQRQMESDNSTSIYPDNTGKAIACCGRLIVGAIPKIFDTARTIRIIGKDGAAQMLPVNQALMGPNGQQVRFDLAKGQYDVQVDVGPNYATKRQEAAEGMMQLVQAMPNVGMMIADLLVKAQDWPDADQIAERIKSMMPPAPGDQQQNPAMQAQQQQAMQAQQMQMEAAKIMTELQVREATAKAVQAEANADKAKFDAIKARIEAGAAGVAPAPMPN